MSATGLILGVLNIFIIIIVLLLIGALVEWGLRAIMNMGVDMTVRRLYLAFVALVALVLLIRLLLGVPVNFIYWERGPP